MALGATALNVVTIGPALLVGGIVIKGQGKKAMTQARKLETKVKVGIAELDQSDALLHSIDQRCEELSTLLGALAERAVAELDVLESEPFQPKIHADRFQMAMALVMSVRDVAACPVLDSTGNVNDKTTGFSVKYTAMTKESQS